MSLIFLGQFFPALLGTIGTLGGWQNSNPIGAIFLHLIALIFASFIGYQLCRCSYRRCELIWARGMAHFISCTTSMLHTRCLMVSTDQADPIHLMIPDFPHNIRIRLARLIFFCCILMLLCLCPVGCLSLEKLN